MTGPSRSPRTRLTLFVAAAYVIAKLIVDIVQALIDPRIRLR